MRDDLGRVPTPYTSDQTRSLLREALDKAGLVVSPKAADVILAHVAFENDHGRRVIQHNFGNLIATREWAGDYWRPPWFADPTPETSPENREKHRLMLEGKAPAAFRAYASGAEGMRFYVETLKRLGLLEAAELGPKGYAQRAVLAFSPGVDPEALGQTLEQLVERLRIEQGQRPAPASGGVLLGLALGALGLWAVVTVTKKDDAST